MSVTLIGMPSCGKSTLGVLLAKRLGYKFIDSDLLLQEVEGKLLHEIIEERGTNGFLLAESKINLSVKDTRAVISTGGSAVYSKEAMEHLASLGCIVYLEISLDTMLKRLGDYSHRGVVLPNGGSLENMFKERKVLYERYADLTVSTDDCDIASLLDDISELVFQK